MKAGPGNCCVNIMSDKEKVLYISSLGDLPLFEQGRHNRIYFGTEFCENAFPRVQDIRLFVQYCGERNVPFSIVVPWGTEKIVGAVKEMLPVLPESSEVIFNSWGVLGLVRQAGHVPVMGRVLVSIKRDPRAVPGSHLEQARNSNLDLKRFQDFLIEEKIGRVELDNVRTGYSAELPPEIRSSLYYPFVYVAITRKCGYPAAMQAARSLARPFSCARECEGFGPVASEIRGGEKIVHSKGNAIFYFNDLIPAELGKLNVDRLVFMPRIPIGA